MTIPELEVQIEKLREQYRMSSGVNRKILEIRGKCLKIALEKKLKKNGGYQRDIYPVDRSS